MTVAIDTPVELKDEEGRSGTVLGIRRVALVEMGLFFTLALLIDSVLLGGNRFVGLEPHPFWIPVLLGAAQYGTSTGLLAALVASLALRLGNIPAQALDQDLYQYAFSLARLPLFWLVASVIFGELRSRHIQDTRRMRQELAAAREERDAIAKSYQNLKRVKDTLEGRVAGQLRTVFTLYQAARAIDKLDEAEVILGVVDLVRTVMRPKKFSLYLLNGNYLESVSHEGWGEEESYVRFFSSDSALFAAVIGRQTYLCAARREDDYTLHGEGVLAGPLVSADTGEVTGMVKIEDLGFVDLTLNTIENFRILCQWVGTALAKARQYQIAKAQGLHSNTEGTVYSSSFFDRQAKFLGRLGQRQGFETSTIMVKPATVMHLTTAERQTVAGVIGRAVQGSLRDTDMAFDFGQQGTMYSVILAGTPLEWAQFVVQKLEKSVRANLPPNLADLPITFVAERVVSALPPPRIVKKELPPLPAEGGGAPAPAPAASAGVAAPGPFPVAASAQAPALAPAPVPAAPAPASAPAPVALAPSAPAPAPGGVPAAEPSPAVPPVLSAAEAEAQAEAALALLEEAAPPPAPAGVVPAGLAPATPHAFSLAEVQAQAEAALALLGELGEPPAPAKTPRRKAKARKAAAPAAQAGEFLGTKDEAVIEPPAELQAARPRKRPATRKRPTVEMGEGEAA